MVHGENRIPYRIDRRLSGLAGPDYDATISFGLPIEPEDSQYGKYRLVTGLCIGVSLFYGVVALIVFRPTRAKLPSVLTAMIAMFALVALSFAIGIVQGFDIGPIKPFAVVAVLMAAFALRWHLRHQLHPS